MGCLKERLLILAICLSVCLSVVTGLRCYVCNYYHLESSDPRVNQALSAITSSSDEDCKNSGTRQQTCRSDREYKCGKVSATVEFSVVGEDVKLGAVTRGCTLNTTISDRCYAATDEDKTKLRAGFASIATVTSVDATGCVCSTDLCNGQLSISAKRFSWLAGLVLAVLARQL
ncbi:uncharacterized protein LOC135466049 isoform X1 [Liolophura sinensis]|uniref:uncharacterized protein LOC135466049 isoform X1 n=1 Tax=Liolophura sinensis TaxID=3198878 RepID=UPI003158B27B